MKITKLAVVISLAFALSVLVVGTVVAAPTTSHPVSINLLADPTPESTVTPAPIATPVPTTTQPTNPVALILSLYLSMPYTQVMGLHAEGLGFGIIARVYLTARLSNGALTPEQVLALFQSGTGWGQIMKQSGVHPGGNGLGSIMSGHANNGSTSHDLKQDNASCPGNSCNAPGHNKNK